MKYTNSLLLVATLSVGASSLMAGLANINYGASVENGGAQFFGADDAAADSVAIGYFAGDTVNTDLTGWTAFGTDSTFEMFGVNAGVLANVETAAADGLTAYLLIADGGLTGLVTLDSWATYSGASQIPTPSPATELAFQIGASSTSANLTTFAGAGTLVTVTDGQGINFLGGFNGNGVSITLSAVPEPSTFAALAGLCALGAVMVRRRRA